MKIKQFIILFLLLISVTVSFGQNLWKKEGIKLPAPVCYASHESHHSFIKPPADSQGQLKSGTLKKAKIEVTYIGFSAEAQNAFQYAVEIWQNLIYSPVPIRVKASMLSLSKGVLGSSSPSDYFKNFNSTQIWNCYYPIALVEKMLGEEVNSAEGYDVIASFNKDLGSWYFGTDGKTPANQYDFVSTVMHELAHGLGYSGFFYTDRGRGGYSDDGYSAAFDQFVENKEGNRLVNTTLFPNPSVGLYQNLTSGWLEFDTKLVESKLPRLYAPSLWDDGSSIYHLDESSYSVGDPNSLMTPFTGSGEAVHDPGPNSLAMLYDMGWRSVTIKHKELKDKEFMSSPMDVEATIESDYDLDSAKTYLYYTTGRFTKIDSVILKSTNIPLVFKAQLPKSLIGEVRYYFAASDVKKRNFRYPSNAPTRYLSFNVGPDNKVPVLKHEPIKYMLASSLSEKVDVEVTDNMGIKSVNLEYFINGGIVKSIVLNNDTNDIYTGNLVFPIGSVKDGDKISYRIVATDISSNNNIGRLPESGYNTFFIQGIQKPVERYVNNFNSVSNDFISSDFNIITVSGFDSPALNTAHPYLSPDTDDMEFNFTAILKYPIILKTGGKMTFDEIVLVEPGETGTKFGDEEFWDYVIVEGSKDGGTSWKPLIDGYDSGAQKSWFNLFNSAMSGQNSTAVPTKDMFIKREIDLLANGNFKAGDTIQVRFRLFSDPYSHGWGWVIDNLSIQEIGTAVNPLLLSSGEISFYPNPAKGRLIFGFQSKQLVDRLEMKAYNSVGKLVFSQSYSVGSTQFEEAIDVSKFQPGLYLFTVGQENSQPITRKILIQ
ncbi:MAG: T9SS type A sorting domain-containing protein [Prolixibacteraceae bacterium]|nr:T9SS type A sorting domain-containing protein [Prolixibacteraceae bacterium]